MGSIAIVGAGAAGLTAALAAVESDPSLEVTLFEADDRVGRSILVTGNGRCNFSNASVSASDYHNSAFVGQVFASLSDVPESAASSTTESFAHQAVTPESYVHQAVTTESFAHQAVTPESYVQDFFARHGLVWREESEGRLYPVTNKASTVLNILRAACATYGVHEQTGADSHSGIRTQTGVRIVSIEPPRQDGKPFTLHASDGAFYRADAVIVAVGGAAINHLDVCGLPCDAATPVLGPLATDTTFTRSLDNIRVRCAVRLLDEAGAPFVDEAGEPFVDEAGAQVAHGTCAPLAIERGELLFRKYGVSGICIFNLSRFAYPGCELSINLLDDVLSGNNAYCDGDARAFLIKRAALLSETVHDASVSTLLRGLLVDPVADAVCAACDIDPNEPATELVCARLAEKLTDFRLSVRGIGDVNQCQVHRGGLSPKFFDPASFESIDVAGLYAVGESLDVDGPCGGYNLHWAWLSGLVAGRAAAQRLRD